MFRPVMAPNGSEVVELNLSAPTLIVFLVALALAILALIGHFTKIDFVTQYQFWLAIAAYVVLAIGCLVKGL
jgi:4-amino-4-deoxy-L-arabinose transferase-like glycosyltransferase